MSNLGRWAVIDIETTGVDANYDQMIDIGWLQFDGLDLVKTYSSLIRTDVKLSQFIQKLTGIKQSQVSSAPMWSKSEAELQELEGHVLLAHNSNFEKMFLEKYFDDLGDGREMESFCDSMHYLPLVFPERSTLNLESFIIDLKIADHEEHRGLSDSIDLLKVMLLSTYTIKQDLEFSGFLSEIMSDFGSEEYWFKTFFKLSTDDLNIIAEQINFNLKESFLTYKRSLEEKDEIVEGGIAENIKFSGQLIKDILQDEKKIQKQLPTYKYRESQEALSLRVGQAFKNGIHALIQAPTGTGKTLGYLLPSALLAKAEKKQILISTGTKALQNQAMLKDIPLLYKILGLNHQSLNVVRLIGSGNHYCELLYRNKQNEKDTLIDSRSYGEKLTEAYFEMLFFYNERVKNYSQILTKDTVPFALKRQIKEFSDVEEGIHVDFRSCTSHKCPFKDNCTYIGGLQRAKEADLIIGNHSLLLAWPKAVDRPQQIVVDEAHKIESEATSAFTMEVNQKDLEGFGKNLPSMIAPVYYLLGNEEKGAEKTQRIRREVASSAKIITENVEKLSELIERHTKKLPHFTDIYWNEFNMITSNMMNNNLEVSIFNHIDSLRYIFKGVSDLIGPFVGKWSVNSLDDQGAITALTLFESFAANIEDTLTTLNNLLDHGESMANSIKYHEEYGYLFSCGPINVGELFYENVLKDTESVVFTSATLANHDGTTGMPQVEWMTGYNMLESSKRFRSGLFLENNFDYTNNAKVYLCTDTPSLYDKSFIPDVMDGLIPLIRDLGGRTLLLFSARVRFNTACEYLLQAFEGEIPLFIQGLGHNVVEEFKKSSNGVLVGMESFGEGIDIPGESLEFIYIDKIPDLRQDLVIQKRRDFYDANFGNEFQDYFLAHRTRSLHQKLGRLIRTDTDKGCVIVTDSRLNRWKSRTLGTFKEMMRPYDIQITNLKDACEKTRDFLI